MSKAQRPVLELAVEALCEDKPARKAALAQIAAAALPGPSATRPCPPPVRPARPHRPALVAPGQVPRRRLGSLQGRVALLHALAHIEFNAIDLGLDMAARFTGVIKAEGLDANAFAADWVRIAADEARHFELLESRLRAFGASYGDLPAHDGLWTAAEATSADPLARLAVAPMALEARGLDVTPTMIERLHAAGDPESAAILEVIHREEVGHVAAGVRWFEALCLVRRLEPEATFRRLVAEHLAGGLKPPFNAAARAAAGFAPAYYDLAGGMERDLP